MTSNFFYSCYSSSSADIKKINNTFLDVETYKIDISVLTRQKSHIYKQDRFENKNLRNKWLDCVSGLTIDFSKSELLKDSRFTELLAKLLDKHDYIENWKVIEKFDNAIASYIKNSQENENFKMISDASTKNLLYLIPTISVYSHFCISIDADTGYFNLTFKSKDSGLMTVLIAERGDLHYSLAERGKKLVKISGTAKIKDPHDFAKFNKILSML